MSGRESLIGAGLAVVLVVGIVDAAAGHDDSSKPAAQSTGDGVVATPTSALPTPAVTPTPSKPRKGRKHHGGGTMQTASPTSTATSAAPTESAEPTSSTSPTPEASQSLPSGVLGTFSYATTGDEGTTIPGTHRDFPKTTKITNKLEGCGVSSTWTPVPQHVQKQVLCPAAEGIKVTSYQTTISFYGVSSGEDFKCSGNSYIFRNDAATGDTWKFTCKSPDAVAHQTTKVIGFENVDVGGTAVRTLHVHVIAKLAGGSTGSSIQDIWIATKKPVLVKETGQVTAQQQNVKYTSSYSLALKSLSPKT